MCGNCVRVQRIASETFGQTCGARFAEVWLTATLEADVQLRFPSEAGPTQDCTVPSVVKLKQAMYLWFGVRVCPPSP